MQLIMVALLPQQCESSRRLALHPGKRKEAKMSKRQPMHLPEEPGELA